MKKLFWISFCVIIITVIVACTDSVLQNEEENATTNYTIGEQHNRLLDLMEKNSKSEHLFNEDGLMPYEELENEWNNLRNNMVLLGYNEGEIPKTQHLLDIMDDLGLIITIDDEEFLDIKNNNLALVSWDNFKNNGDLTEVEYENLNDVYETYRTHGGGVELNQKLVELNEAIDIYDDELVQKLIIASDILTNSQDYWAAYGITDPNSPYIFDMIGALIGAGNTGTCIILGGGWSLLHAEFLEWCAEQ